MLPPTICTAASESAADPLDRRAAAVATPTVASLLSTARQAAKERKRLANLTHPNYAAATAQAHAALEAREQAHQLDPAHADPAWAVDLAENRNIPHEQVVRFLRRYVDTP